MDKEKLKSDIITDYICNDMRLILAEQLVNNKIITDNIVNHIQNCDKCKTAISDVISKNLSPISLFKKMRGKKK